MRWEIQQISKKCQAFRGFNDSIFRRFFLFSLWKLIRKSKSNQSGVTFCSLNVSNSSSEDSIWHYSPVKSVLSFNRFSILNNSLITLRIRSRINIQIPPLKIYVIRGLQNLHKIRIKIAVLISLFYRKFQFHFNRNSRRIFLPWNFRRTQNRTQWIISLSLSNSLSIACTLSSHRWFGRSASGFPLGNTVTILSQQCKSVTKRPDQVTAICRVTTLTRFPIYSRWSTRRDHFSSTPEGNLSPDKAVST